MKRIITTIIFIFLFSIILLPQELFVPRNIQNAYDKGTRSLKGNPGGGYWQNKVSYTITAEVDVNTRRVTGSEIIKFKNNSPDNLNELLFHLYQNFYRKGNARNFSISGDAVYEGVTISKIIVNGEQYDPNSSRVSIPGTIMTVRLNSPIVSGGEAEIELDWSFVITKNGNVRHGTYGDASFFVAYWYPQLAVYDDIDGWDRFNFNGEQEFYTNFADYDVRITVPNNSGVWATGILQNPEAVLSKNSLQRYKKAWISDEKVSVVGKEDIEKGDIYSKVNGKNTWHYKAEYVPDFTFAISNNYLWDALSVQLKGNKERTYIAAVYNPASADFYEVAEISKRAILFFSEEMPGINYPYPACTIWNGSGGMEFPMIINNGSSSTLAGTVGVTSHEIAHMYMPFYMGTNEKKYAWMDEGWAVMLPFDFQEREAEGNDPRGRNGNLFASIAGTERDVPLNVISMYATGNGYRNHAYSRSGLAYDFLRGMIGDSLFKKALHLYIERWNGKHPMPYDFFYTFNEAAGEDLNWFWSRWFFGNNYPDLAIKQAVREGKKIKVVVENRGMLPLPVSLVFSSGDKSVTEYRSASVWRELKEVVIETGFEGDEIIIDLGNVKIPDVNQNNNMIKLGL